MPSELTVEIVDLQSGEQLPLLKGANGLPLWDSTLFVLTELRARNLAVNTILQAIRAIKFGEQLLEYLSIDLGRRLREGTVLELHEIDALSELFGFTQEELDALEGPGPRATDGRRSRVVSFESVRMRRQAARAEGRVSPQTRAVRMLYFRDYLDWRISQALHHLDQQRHAYRQLADSRVEVRARLEARIPKSSELRSANAREGIDEAMELRIRTVTAPDSAENPWKNRHVRIRNQLIFLWLVSLGLRRGELLGIKIMDVDLRRNEVTVVRRPDDPEDPRSVKPRVKTKGRLLKLETDLAELTRAYVQQERRRYINARKHPFLFVATGSGEALSASALTKLFIELRTKVPGLPEELCPHVLRHTWNDRFSVIMDRKGVSSEAEEQMRKQHMGWSDRSQMAAVYTRRHVQRKANEASLELQAQALGKAEGSDS